MSQMLQDEAKRAETKVINVAEKDVKAYVDAHPELKDTVNTVE